MGKDYYGPLVDQMPPEFIIANGGRAAVIRKLKKSNRKQRILGIIYVFFGMLWGLSKAVVLALTVLYFVNALLF